MRRFLFLPLFVVAAVLGSSAPAPGADTPVELGHVPWIRDFDEGAEAARKTGKPILLLFNEVPG